MGWGSSAGGLGNTSGKCHGACPQCPQNIGGNSRGE